MICRLNRYTEYAFPPCVYARFPRRNPPLSFSYPYAYKYIIQVARKQYIKCIFSRYFRSSLKVFRCLCPLADSDIEKTFLVINPLLVTLSVRSFSWAGREYPDSCCSLELTLQNIVLSIFSSIFNAPTGALKSVRTCPMRALKILTC